VTALTALIGAILIGAAGAHAELTVKGDAAAWDEVAVAFKKLDALSAYRMKITSKAGTDVMEIVSPNAFHSISQMGTTTNEVMNVNGQARSRITGLPGVPSGWQCFEVTPPNFSDSLAGVQGTVDNVSREPDTTIEGTSVRTYMYLYTQPGQTTAAKNTTYVGTENGLPRRTVIGADPPEMTIDYYDYGAKIEITLPPCG
jgi:hypothetical protein